VVIEWAWVPESEDAMAVLLRGSVVLSDLYVVDPYRSHGIGSSLLAAADQLAQARGYPLTGLGVAVDNPRARSLYERHGYKDAGIGQYITGWRELDEQGEQRWIEEQEICMIKRYA
jgi:ribosomal protein S18 acetylase RimI-like enzyme